MVNIVRRPVLLIIIAVLIVFAMVIADYNKSDAETRSSRRKKREPAQPVIIFSPEIQKCGACHQTYVDSMEDHKMLGGKHNDITEDCFGCHEKTGLSSAHEKVNRPPGKLFRQRKYANELCLTCHDGYEDLVEKTKDNKSFITVDEEVINPHDTHVGKVECFNCHKMHKDKPPIEYCYGCHHARQLNHCKDCHGSPKEESGNAMMP